jgi:light-regulated signal transduction histidine kinase (bacteriophytochrome)
MEHGADRSRQGDRVDFRARSSTEDECGGLRTGGAEQPRPPGDRRGRGRSGLGLGLSICRKAVAAHRGEVRTRDLPGKGCIFSIELPLAGPETMGAARAC